MASSTRSLVSFALNPTFVGLLFALTLASWCHAATTVDETAFDGFLPGQAQLDPASNPPGARIDDDFDGDDIRPTGEAGISAWPMRQRDAANTGRGDFAVPASRLDTNFFRVIRWQKPSPDSPNQGNLGASSMVFYDGAGPGGSDLVAAGYHWPKGVQGMDRHTGALFWQGNTDGGESIADNTPAFSPSGATIYVVNDDTPGPMMAFAAASGPSFFWHNGGDLDPFQLSGLSPKVAPDGRLFSAFWDDRPYGGTDSGMEITVSWAAATPSCSCHGGPALWQGPDGLIVVSGGRCGMVKAWHGDTGDELWSVDLPGQTDADPTIDPASGNIYLPVGFDSVWIAGLDRNGNPLWTDWAMPVFDWEDGFNHRQRAQSAGCLSADGLTYYFQTVSEEGDGRLYAIRTADGSVKWSVETASRGWEGVSSSPIVTANGVVVVGNNDGGVYFAIRDAGAHGEVLAMLPLADGGVARSSATLAPDGLLYLPARLKWTASNGDNDPPTQAAANLFTAFDLNSQSAPDLIPWRQIALPETGPRDRHTALGSDGSSVFFTRAAQANAPFYRIAKGSSNSVDWQAAASLPLPSGLDINGGAGDLAFLDGALWTLALRDSSSGARCIYRYDLGSDSWTKGSATIGDGPNAACAPLAADRILGGWIGWDMLYNFTAWSSGASTQAGSVPGGAAHPWDSCMGGGYAYFLKHRGSPHTNGVLVRLNQTGALQMNEIAGLPFNPGMGCAIEFLPGQFFRDGHDRLWVLRGGLGSGEGDGGGWIQDATAENVAVYDLATAVWTAGSTGFAVDDGSEACLAGDTLYVLAANGETNPLRFVPLNDPDAPASRWLTIQSAYGMPSPAAGEHEHLIGQKITCTAPATVEVGGIIYRCTGWQGTGSVGQGAGTSVTVTLEEDSQLVWLWATTDCSLTVTQQGSGFTDIASASFALGTVKTVTAYAAPEWQFSGWSGDTNGCSIYDNTITVPMSQSRQLIARFVRQNPVADAARFVSPGGSHTLPFNTWLSAATNIQAAIDAASAGETIVVADGVYRLSAEIVVNKGVALKSVNGPGLTVLDGCSITRCLRLSHTNSLVDGFTVTGGQATNMGGGVLMDAGGLRHSRIEGNRSLLGDGGGIVLTQGCWIEYCHVLNNSATNGSGGGIAERDNSDNRPCLVQNCVIAGNEAKIGGGVAVSTGLELRGLFVKGNRASQYGGGVFAHILQMANCTVVENEGGGVSVDWTTGAHIANSIIDRNHAGLNTVNFSGVDEFYFTQTYTVPFAGGFETSPDYADPEHGDFRLRPGSAGINQGASQSWMTNAADLDGHPRVLDGQVDLGAWEYAGDRFLCDLAHTMQSAFLNEPVVLEAMVFGLNTNGLTYSWDLDDDGIFELIGAQLGAITNAYPAPGTYAVSLMVSNAAGQAASIRRPAAVEAGPREIFVSPSGAAWPPYSSWALAARSIHAALEVARGGSVIWVTNGVYELAGELRVLHGVTLQSVNGADNTFIAASGANRCFWIGHSNALVAGFTITNGYVLGGDGGGVYLESGTLSNCTVAGNESETRSAPPADDIGGSGGGIYVKNGRVASCRVSHNTGRNGGGLCVENGWVENCWVSDNTGMVGGVMIIRGTADRCVICGNYGYENGGAAIERGALRNSLIVENITPEPDSWGGFDLFSAAGASMRYNDALLENCTIAGNLMIPYTGPWGVGEGLQALLVFQGLARNTIVASNDCTWQALAVYGTNLFVCSSDPIAGPGNFQADPRFINLAGGDYRLRGDSPCINAGTNFAWMTGALDLAGQPRVSQYWADLGAYEYDPGQIVLTWTGPPDPYFHGTELLAWDTVTGRTQAMTVALQASKLGATRIVGSGLERTGALDWDTTLVEDGRYELRAVLRDEAGGLLAETSRDILIQNALLGHAGTVGGSETWSNDIVHLIEGTLTVAAGQTLAILPGAIVKCVPGARIILENGARLQAEGTPDAPIVFTSWADDAAGGDSNCDGSQSLPQPGDWLGFEPRGGAILALNPHVETRYLLVRHAGELAANETWTGQSVHWITDDLTVPAGVTLAINPGAVVKFDPLKSITVEPGASLRSEGTRARPVIFTSIKDDAVSGDTSGDGDASAAAPGDWGGLRLDGAAYLQHTILRFGAGGDLEDMPAMVKVAAGQADVVMLDCRLEQALLDAVSTWGGSMRMTNCVLASNGRGILVRENSSALLVNCTLYQHNWGVVAHGGISRVVNSIIGYSAEYGVFGMPTEFAYNNVWSPTSGGYQAGVNGNLSVDPRFRNPDTGNFQLAYLSPMIDAADSSRAHAADLMEAPRYDDPRTANTGLAGTGGAMADLGAFEFVEGAESDLDLAAQNVAGPSSATAGDTATVTWQILNQGGGVVSGQWHDQILLVPDSRDGWSQSLVVAEVLSSATLGPGAAAGFSAAVRVPGGTEGNWRWQVKANSQGEVFEGLHWNNNLSDLSSPMVLAVPALPVNTTLLGMLLGQNQPAWYKISDSTGLDALIVLDSSSMQGRVRLYAGRGRMPSEQYFDRRSDALNSPDATLSLPGLADAEPIYLMAMPESLPYAPAAFQISAQAMPFGLAAVSPVVVGNQGASTLTIDGYGFTTNTQARLRPVTAGPELAATRWILADSTRGYATFDLSGAAAVFHDLRLEEGVREAVQSNSVLVVVAASGETSKGEFRARLSAPSAVRAGRVFRGFVHYENTGTSDMPAPLLILEADANTTLFPVGMPGESARRLHFLAGAQGRPQPSILSPGAQYTFAFQGISHRNETISIKLYRLGSDSAEPMDYAMLRTDIVPANPHPLFDSAYGQLTDHMGTNQGSYVSALGQAADRAAGYGQTDATEQSLLTYVIRESIEKVQDAAVSGRVFLADTSHPLGRVQVFLAPADPADTNLYGTVSWHDGTFGIRDVPPGTYWISVRNHLPARIARVTVANASTPVTGLTVVAGEAAAEIAGTITEQSSGRPVTNATLVARGPYRGTTGFAATDTNGAYRIGGLYSGAYILEIDAPGALPEPVANVAVESGRTAYRSIVISRQGAVIQGQVCNAAGAPVADALVSAEWLDHTPAYGQWRRAQTRSAADGSYAFAALPPGRYSVAASCAAAGVSNGHAVQLAGVFDTANVDPVLRNDVTLTGAIIDAGNGAPVPNARISVATTPAWDATFTTDASGRFTIPNLTVGAWLLNAYASGYSIGKTNVTVAVAGSCAVTLALEPKGALTVQVSNHGAPLEGAMITVLPWASESVQHLVTGASGNRQLERIPPGQYSVVLGAVGGLSHSRQDFEIAPDRRSHSFQFNLSLSSIAGHLFAPDGSTGVANATVYLLRQGQMIGGVRTDADGRYVIALFEPGTFDLLAVGNDFCLAPATNVVVAGSDSAVTVDFRQPPGDLIVHVADLAGGPSLSNAWVELRPVAGLDRKIQAPLLYTDASGHSRFSAVAPGDYQLWIHASDHALHQQALRMGNEPARVDVALAAGRRVFGQVISRQTGVPFARVDLAATNGPMLLSTLTDTNGHYEFTSAPQGVFDLIVRPHAAQDCPPAIRTGVDLLSASERREDFNLDSDSAAAVSGCVVDGAGRRVTRAVVRLEHAGHCTAAITLTDAQGEFSFRRCPPGSFHLSADAAGYAGASQPVTIAAGQPVTGLAVTLSLPLLANGAIADHEQLAPQDQGKRLKAAAGGVIDYFQDLYSNQDWGDLATSDFWNDVFSGSMGLTDPQLAYENSDIDLDRDVIEPFEKAKAEGKIDCVLDAYDDALQRYKNLNRALAGWNGSYQAAKKLNAADANLAVSRAALAAAKAVKLIGDIMGGPAGEALGCLSPDLQASILGIADNAAGWAAAFQQGAASGDFDEAGAINQFGNTAGSVGNLAMDGWKSASFGQLDGICSDLGDINRALQSGQGTLPANYLDKVKVLKDARIDAYDDIALANKIKMAPDLLGKLTSLLDVLSELNNLMASIADMNEDVLNTTGDYLNAQHTYCEALKAYRAASNRLIALAKDCKTSDGTEAEPPDYEAGDEIDKADIPKPFELDPNDKITTGAGAFGFIQALDRIHYTIHFENVSTASAPAQLVVITDRLHSSLDETTLELGEIGFNNVTVWPAAGLTRFEATTNVATDPYLVRIRAELAPETRTVTWTLQSVDPVTGDYPEDPWAGFLPPNTTNHVGDGYVTFSVLPKTGAAETFITNRAVIVFGVNDPIPTPVVTNRIDRTPPASAVDPLPAFTAAVHFPVSWSGTDAAAGIAGYDIYVSSNGGPWHVWLANTPLISAMFHGSLKTTYSFFSIARDSVGNVEAPPSVADATTTTADNQAPVLAAISDGMVRVNETMILTNLAFDPDGHTLRFSLGAAPSGASIVPDSGLLFWTPVCAQGSSTNLFEVRVTDNGTPPLTAAQTFRVFVPECIEAGLGSTIMQVGTTSSVPVRLLSTVALTNLTFTVVFPADRLAGFVLTPNSSQVLNQDLRLLSPGRLEVSFTLPASSVLHGPTNAASLVFTAPTNQTSIFLPLLIEDVDGWRPDGGLAANARGQAGRVVIIGREPLLEGVRGADRKPHLLLYGNPGASYTLEWRTNVASGAWHPLDPVAMTNLVQDAHTGELSHPARFFQAR